MPHSSMEHFDDRDSILIYLESRSLSMFNYVNDRPQTEFSLWFKNLTHSDLTNRGKRNGSQEGLDKNLLYYLSLEEMQEIEKTNDKPFESAKQSNIGMTEDFYTDLIVPRLVRRSGPQVTQHEHVCLNDYVDVFLVNDTMRYFTMDYTHRVLERLNKNSNWQNNETVELIDNQPFTPIQLTQAIHGLGTANDINFHKLRLSMFCNDTIIFLIEHSVRKKLYILLEKNPRFFTLIGESNSMWENYINTNRERELNGIIVRQGLDENDEHSRAQQSAWKNLLAREMMNYTTHEGEVFCPFTQISADFNSVPMLFIASHIKRFADSNCSEQYDVNNGLLLCANADALFDKHMITISEDKRLIFSFLIENDNLLKQRLLLNQPIFNLILNDKRMEYMADHRRIFFEKEQERRTV